MTRCSRPFYISVGVVVILITVAGCSRATDYYVSLLGNDSGSGTSPGIGAWQTLAKVNGQSFLAGDRILLEGGQTFGGTLAFYTDDIGTAANPIIVSSYGGAGRATINSGINKSISIYNTAGFAISELILTGTWDATSQSGNISNGIELYTDLPDATKLDFVHVNNVEISGFKQNGILIGAFPADGSKSGWTNVQLTGCVVHDNGSAGIFSYGYFSGSATTYAHANIVVRDCVVYSNRGVLNSGTHSGNGILLSDVNGATIERCLAYDNGDLNDFANGGPIGIWTYDSNAVLIQFNESHSNKSGSTLDGGGFDLDGGTTNSTVQFNYSHGNQGAGYLMFQFSGARPLLGGNVIRYNISENDGRKGNHAGIFIGGGSPVQNNRFHNNTLYISPAPSGMPAAFKNLGAGTGNTVRNNILQTSGGILLIDSSNAGTASLLFQGNDYWSSGSNFAIKWGSSTYSSLAAWRSATAQEKIGATATGLTVDPKLKNPGHGGTIGNPALLGQLDAYRLQPASPLINKGLNLFALFGVSPGTRDYFANTLPQAVSYDIGAHELGAPVVASTASATPNPAIYGTAALAVTGADEAGEPNLLYTWAATGTPPAPVGLGSNGTNAAKNITATFSKAGTYSFSVTITNAASLSTNSHVNVTVNQTYEFWLAEHGLTGAEALPDADPYGVGIENLLAYGLGIEPQAANPNAGLPSVQIKGGFLTLSYQAPRSDVTYQTEWSTNLSGWTTAGISSNLNGTSRTDAIPIGTDSRKFMRLRILR